jgi:hypothetical protein
MSEQKFRPGDVVKRTNRAWGKGIVMDPAYVGSYVQVKVDGEQLSYQEEFLELVSRPEETMNKELEEYKKLAFKVAQRVKRDHPDWSDVAYQMALKELGLRDPIDVEDIYREGAILEVRTPSVHAVLLKNEKGWRYLRNNASGLHTHVTNPATLRTLIAYIVPEGVYDSGLTLKLLN